MNFLAGYSPSVCLFLGVLLEVGSSGWVLGERGGCVGCSTRAEGVELSETETPSPCSQDERHQRRGLPGRAVALRFA